MNMFTYKKDAQVLINQRDHALMLAEERLNKSNAYQAQLFNSFKTMKQQSKGLQRMARKIKAMKMRIEGLLNLHRDKPVAFANQITIVHKKDNHENVPEM